MGHDVQIDLAEHHEGAQHDDHGHLAVACAPQRAGIDLVDAAQQVEGGNVPQQQGAVGHHLRLAVEEDRQLGRKHQHRHHQHRRYRQGDRQCTTGALVGPLGVPTEMAEGPCAVIGGGVGLAIAFPVAKHLVETGHEVHAIMGARTKDLLLMEDQFRELLDEDHIHITTDDGSYGRKGLVTEGVEEVIKREKVNKCFAIGPAIMMKFVCLLTKKYEIPTDVSLNTIMVDGTGMCGACRVTVGGEVKFACVDGPEFDGHLVNFDEAMQRQQIYKTQEGRAYLAAKEKDTHHGGCGQCGGEE